MTDLREDLLEGAPAIAAFGGWSERRVRYLYENKQAPIFKSGGRLAAFKSALRQHFEALAVNASNQTQDGGAA